MFCKNCGAIVHENSKFCLKCGCQISNTIFDSSEESSDNDSKSIEDDFNNNQNSESDNFENSDESFVNDVDFDLTDDESKYDLNSSVSSKSLSQTNSRNKTKFVIVVTSVSLIILLFISIFTNLNSAERQMEKALSTKNAYEVNTLYKEAYGNSRKLQKYDEVISHFLDEVINDLNSKVYSNEDLVQNGYTVVNRDLESDWGDLIYSADGSDTIEQSLSSNNQVKWEELQNIICSRCYYCTGVAYRDANNSPQDAIDCFKRVVPSDKYYSTINDEISLCVDMYIDQTLAEAQDMMNKGDINGALSKVEIINEYLESNGLSSPETEAKVTDIKSKYAEQYAMKAEECFKNKDAKGAIGHIEVSMELQPDNADYKAKYDTYQQYLPYYFYDENNVLMKEKDKGFYGNIHFDKAMISNDNQEMSHCLEWYNNNYRDNSYSYDYTYYLAGKYDTVTGTMFVSEINKSYKGYGKIEVYGDGKLIYTSKTFSAGVLPEDISFNVTGVQKLCISFYAVADERASNYFGISNLTAQKDFPE